MSDLEGLAGEVRRLRELVDKLYAHLGLTPDAVWQQGGLPLELEPQGRPVVIPRDERDLPPVDGLLRGSGRPGARHAVRTVRTAPCSWCHAVPVDGKLDHLPDCVAIKGVEARWGRRAGPSEQDSADTAAKDLPRPPALRKRDERRTA